MSLSHKQFGSLYHGTDTSGLTELDQHKGGGPRYSAMRNSYGWNYATTDLETAKMYARDASGRSSKKSGKKLPAVVYEVEPRRKSDSWGPDPDSGPGGWHDGPANKREALDIHEGGGEVSLRFKSPLRVNREVWVEDSAYDETGYGRSFS